MRLFGLVFTTGRRFDQEMTRVEKIFGGQTEHHRLQAKHTQDRLSALEKELWKRHGEPYTTGRPGNYNVFKDWWCKSCRTPWPCADAQLAAGSMAGDVTLRWGKLEARQIKKDSE